MINLKMTYGDINVNVDCSTDDPELHVNSYQFLTALNTFLNCMDLYDHCKITLTKNLKPNTSVYEPDLNYDMNTMGT